MTFGDCFDFFLLIHEISQIKSNFYTFVIDPRYSNVQALNQHQSRTQMQSQFQEQSTILLQFMRCIR